MREIRRRARALNELTAVMLQEVDTALIEFVDQPAAVGVGVGALLRRPIEEQVRLARENVEPVDQVFEVSTDKRMDVIRGQVAVARERR